MKNTENSLTSSSRKDRAELDSIVNAWSQFLGEQDSIVGKSLIERVANYDNLMKASDAVIKNKGAAGIDGMEVYEVKSHIRKYYPQLRQKLLDGSYRPQPVRRVEIPKSNGKMRKLGIPVVRDRVIQQAIRQVIEPSIDKQFLDNSHGFRPRRSPKTALKQCVNYYEEGYHYVVDCDLKEYFDTINHDKLMYYVERFVPDKMILKLIRSFIKVGAIDLKGSFEISHNGTPQGGVISPLLSNIYLHELDKELVSRGHKFVRYADDFVIFVKSRRAGERVLTSITRYIEKDLKLKVNQEKSKVGSPKRLKFLSCLIHRVNGVCRYRPTKEKQKEFRDTLKRLTSRKRSGDFGQIVKELNRVIRGWMNYFGTGFIKGFIRKTESWLHRRIRQLCIKRWKKPKTKIKKLMQYGLDEDSAKRIAFSRKKYWRLSLTQEVHRALPTKRLYQWGLVDMLALAESAYLTY